MGVDTMRFPGPRGCTLMENTSFSRFSACLTLQGPASSRWRHSGLQQFGNNICHTWNPLYFSIWRRQNSNRDASRCSGRPTSIHRRRMVTLNKRRTCHSFYRCLLAIAMNKNIKLKRWLAKSPANTNKYFLRPNISFNKTWKPIHWKIKFSPQLISLKHPFWHFFPLLHLLYSTF